MSVEVADTQVLEYIAHGLKRLAYNTTVNRFFCSVISSHFKNKDVEAEALRLVKSWAYLNEMSYAVAYNMMEEPFECADLVQGNQIFKLEPVQLFKYVFYLYYNIEVCTIESAKSYRRGRVKNVPPVTDQQRADAQLLKDWYYEYAVQLVKCMPEYEQAKYCDPVAEPVHL